MAALLFGGAIPAAFSGVDVCLLAFTVWLCVCTQLAAAARTLLT